MTCYRHATINSIAALGLLGILSGPASAGPSDTALSTKVEASGTEEPKVTMAPLAAEESDRLQVTETGLGALHWAAQHPGHAWRILLPVEPGDAAGRSASSPSM